MRLIRFSLTMALGLPLALEPAQPPMAAGAGAPETYAQLREQLLAALQDCTLPKPESRCEPASQQLQKLIAVSEGADAREQRPRCLGALTQLETHLSVFRWGLEPLERLQAAIGLVEQACPAPPNA